MGVLEGLKPKSVFTYFEEIAGIPHGSHDTKMISDYVAEFASRRGLRFIQDAFNNVIVWKDGSKGFEGSETVILQGHMDMVCEKEDGYVHDFHVDPLKLELNNGIVSARGTTLGGDDGIAIAYMLALLDSDEIPHPPLECVFTVDEEVGMLGAAAMDMSVLEGRRMINIDSEEEGYLLVSCAGGVRANISLSLQRRKDKGTLCKICVSGLTGGHSGVEIDKQRGNANILTARLVEEVLAKGDARLCGINGGMADNAIPRKAEAVLVTSDFSAVQEIVASKATALKAEYRLSDPGMEISCEEIGAEECNSFVDDCARQAITLMRCLPNGIQRMSLDIPGLVQTSLNMGIVQTTDTAFSISYAVRSSLESEKQELTDRIELLAHALGATVSYSGPYPAWEYPETSPLRDTMCEVFERMYGRKPVIQALHAGVECGLFAGKLGNLDAVSFGPDMKDIHTPQESLDSASVARTWDYLLEVLKELK